MKNLQQYSTLAVARSVAAADRHPAPQGSLSVPRLESTTEPAYSAEARIEMIT